MRSIYRKWSTVGLMATTAFFWSSSSHACSDTPVLASVCIMATPATFGSFNNTYVPATGQLLLINQYTALYSLIGVTYGGDARTNFNLPDLRGRVIIGANTDGTYPAGKKGGQASMNLTMAQLPPHYFIVPALTVNLSHITATTTLSSLSATADLAGITVSGPPTGLVIKTVSGSGGQGTPSGNYLGKPPAATANLYANGTPDSNLNNNALGGTMTLTVAAGSTAPVTVTGNANTTIGGSSVTNPAATNTLGSGAVIDLLPPYLPMTYYIAANNGIYPSRDN